MQNYHYYFSGTLQKSADSFLHFESKSTILALEKQNDIEHDKQSGGPEPPVGYKKANVSVIFRCAKFPDKSGHYPVISINPFNVV